SHLLSHFLPYGAHHALLSFPTRRSSDLEVPTRLVLQFPELADHISGDQRRVLPPRHVVERGRYHVLRRVVHVGGLRDLVLGLARPVRGELLPRHAASSMASAFAIWLPTTSPISSLQ